MSIHSSPITIESIEQAKCIHCKSILPDDFQSMTEEQQNKFKKICQECSYIIAKKGNGAAVSCSDEECNCDLTIYKGKYGLMPEHDYRTMGMTLFLVMRGFQHIMEINTCEIGVHKGDTSRGIRDFFKHHNVRHHHTGIDNRRDFNMNTPFPECKFILGNSIEVYNQISDESQHFLFIDGCHNYPMTMADFLCYSDKIVPGGYVAFHDTGKQIPHFKDYQGMGNKADKDMFISCRKAVTKLGLLDNTFPGWELIFDEADETKDTGGIVVVRKKD